MVKCLSLGREARSVAAGAGETGDSGDSDDGAVAGTPRAGPKRTAGRRKKARRGRAAAATAADAAAETEVEPPPLKRWEQSGSRARLHCIDRRLMSGFRSAFPLHSGHPQLKTRAAMYGSSGNS